MKTYALPLFLAAALFMAACGGSTTEESLAAPAQESAIELTAEEAEILDAADEAPVEEAAPVTKENYEEALEQLEAEINSDQ